METLWESSEEEDHLSHPLPLSFPIASSNSNRDMSVHKLKKCTQLSALPWGNYKKLPRSRLSLNRRLSLKLEGLAKNYEDQQLRMV